MALSRKYSGFNLYSAVPVPTQSSAALVHTIGLEPITQSVFLQDTGYDFACRAYKFTLLITICEMRAYGAQGRTRTGTHKASDFESDKSTNFITWANRRILIRVPQTLVKNAFRGLRTPLRSITEATRIFGWVVAIISPVY